MGGQNMSCWTSICSIGVKHALLVLSICKTIIKGEDYKLYTRVDYSVHQQHSENGQVSRIKAPKSF
jgi:hypothetical protein